MIKEIKDLVAIKNGYNSWNDMMSFRYANGEDGGARIMDGLTNECIAIALEIEASTRELRAEQIKRIRNDKGTK